MAGMVRPGKNEVAPSHKPRLLPGREAAKLVSMSIRVNDTFRRADPVRNAATAYPADYPLRIIVEAASEPEAALREAVSAYRVSAPLLRSQASSGGRYLAFGVSVEFRDRGEHEAFVAAVKRVPGVRMVL